jgi:hypothetical protein
MDPEPELAVSFRPESKNRPATVVKVGLGLVVALALFAAFPPWLRPAAGKDLVWLSASEFGRITRPGPFTRVKYRLLRLAGPLLQRFMDNKPRVNIDSRFLCLSPVESDQLGLDAPAGTNADGGRAWILSSTQLESVRRHLKSLPEGTTLVGPRITTMDGSQAQVFAGESTPVMGSLVSTGVTLELTPQVSSRAIDLLIGITSTEAVASTASNAAAVRTNLALSCRVLFPNAGGLLVAGPSGPIHAGTDYWCLVSATAVDAQGKLLKK